MADQSFQKVQLVLAEPRPEMSGVLNSALSPRGLRQITVCRDAAGLRAAMDATPVDVLLCDIELAGLKFRETMQRIRHNEMGRNPFVHIIAMVSISGRDQIRRLIGAGVDDLIRKPMPPNRVASRFDNLVRPRKPFVVTDGYIGPNRRKAPRIGDASGLVKVASSLRSKAVDNAPHYKVQEEIDRAWHAITEMRARSGRHAIEVLADRILGFYDGRGTEQELRRDLGYLVAKAEELISHHRNSETAHVAEIAACMTGVARRIVQSPKYPSKTDMKLMPHLAGATRKSAASPLEAIETVREITALIRDYLALR